MGGFKQLEMWVTEQLQGSDDALGKRFDDVHETFAHERTEYRAAVERMENMVGRALHRIEQELDEKRHVALEMQDEITSAVRADLLLELSHTDGVIGTVGDSAALLKSIEDMQDTLNTIVPFVEQEMQRMAIRIESLSELNKEYVDYGQRHVDQSTASASDLDGARDRLHASLGHSDEEAHGVLQRCKEVVLPLQTEGEELTAIRKRLAQSVSVESSANTEVPPGSSAPHRFLGMSHCDPAPAEGEMEVIRKSFSQDVRKAFVTGIEKARRHRSAANHTLAGDESRSAMEDATFPAVSHASLDGGIQDGEGTTHRVAAILSDLRSEMAEAAPTTALSRAPLGTMVTSPRMCWPFHDASRCPCGSTLGFTIAKDERHSVRVFGGTTDDDDDDDNDTKFSDRYVGPR